MATIRKQPMPRKKKVVADPKPSKPKTPTRMYAGGSPNFNEATGKMRKTKTRMYAGGSPNFMELNKKYRKK